LHPKAAVDREANTAARHTRRGEQPERACFPLAKGRTGNQPARVRPFHYAAAAIAVKRLSDHREILVVGMDAERYAGLR